MKLLTFGKHVYGGAVHPLRRPRLIDAQMWKIMKLTAILLTAAFLQVSARGHSQEVSLSLTNAPLEKVFREIQRQTGYGFLYTKNMLQDLPTVTLDVKNVPVTQVLDQCFHGLDLSYSLDNKTIVITRREAAREALPAAVAPPIDVHGRVTDSLGKPLAGASVIIKGAKKGVQTDDDGNFLLKGVDPEATVVVSFTGYETQAIAVNGRTTIVVHMSAGVKTLLDAVVEKGYYSTTNRLNTGDVSVVSSKEIGSQPVTNTLLALQSLVPGLFITQQSGVAGAGVQVLIQGQHSINNGNDPFYVVDGVPYPQELLPNFGYVLGQSGTGLQSSYGSPFSYLNPDDVESVSVLKDADATAIYGSRAANGAIIITTKKGKVGKTKIEFKVSDGFGHITKTLPVMNTQQYLDMRHEAFNNDGLQPSLPDGDYDLLFWDTTRNTNWQKVLINNTAKYATYTLSVSGGLPAIQYLISGNYHRETSPYANNFSDQEGSVHVNLHTSSEDKKLQLQLSTEYVFDNNQLPSQDLTYTAVTLPPDAPPLYNPDGSVNWALDSTGNSTWPNQQNPIALYQNTYQAKANNLVSSLNISYNILNDLQFKANLGYTNMTLNDFLAYRLSSYAPSLRPYNYPSASFTYNYSNSWNIEPQLDYHHRFGKNNLQLLAGSSVQRNNSNGSTYTAWGYPSDLLIASPSAASNVLPGSSTIAEYRYGAVFGRASYNYNERYIVNLTMRRDGSSRFGPSSQVHNFAAAGAGWIFSEEDLIKNNLSFLSFGKLTASYGTTGNDQIGDYQYLSTYNSLASSMPYQGTSSLIPTGLANPYLQWEETKKLSVGMDLGFNKDKVLVNGTYFQSRTSNQLGGYSLPATTGFGNITRNFPATVQNSGWELTIHSTNIKTKRFTWTSTANFTIPRNKLLSFPNLASSSYANSLIIGKSINSLRVFRYAGVNDTTGVYQFVSAKGTITTNPAVPTDQTILVNMDPKIYANLSNTLEYKGVSLSFNFSYQNKVEANGYFGSPVPGQELNQPTYLLDRWQKPGDVKPIQKFSTSGQLNTSLVNAETSNAYWSDFYMLRLQNLSLSWHLPAAWTTRARMSSASLFVQAQHLLTITNYKGMDPETGRFFTLPPLRIITFGLDANF